ncbi:hypothetical protein L227DRAFT_286221 [Lentinus tigrinus ALCF2SS1-6]|uniref:Uncharacterized protein n=1 Tax=Lentinus tigrinus ALCF2SS1-6 TaxID=1328759 RepID=A0A5C2RYE4_9APHY|nr:hypothetical protein L227DRAFT_286221 [Lentinus tigrinus ALCF2SS1-6]
MQPPSPLLVVFSHVLDAVGPLVVVDGVEDAVAKYFLTPSFPSSYTLPHSIALCHGHRSRITTRSTKVRRSDTPWSPPPSTFRPVHDLPARHAGTQVTPHARRDGREHTGPTARRSAVRGGSARRASPKSEWLSRPLRLVAAGCCPRHPSHFALPMPAGPCRDLCILRTARGERLRNLCEHLRPRAQLGLCDVGFTGTQVRVPYTL